MSQKSKIEWTDRTWNPLRGCARVSAGCQHCYAERVAYRFSGPGQPYEHLVRMTTQGPKWTGTVQLVPDVLGAPLSWVKPSKVFVNSMSDLFHESVPFEFIASVFAVMSVTTRHTYQVLTKQPARMLEFFKWVASKDSLFPGDRIHDHWPPHLKWRPQNRADRGGYDNCGPSWPCENIWLGVSAEDQKAANARIPILLQVPAAVRFVSMEPLLGPVDLQNVEVPCESDILRRPWDYKGYTFNALQEHDDDRFHQAPATLDWVIVGGESGPGARPMHPDWARSLRDQCAVAGVPFLFKQWGEWIPMMGHASGVPVHGRKFISPDGTVMGRAGKKAAGRLLDGRPHDGFPMIT